MTTVITTLAGGDGITTADSMTKINANFDSLNTNKIETSYLDTDNTLAANSDTKIPSQKAVKAYVDTLGNVNASETARGIVEEATDAEVTAGTATGATGAKLFVTPAKLATRFSSLFKFGGTGVDGALAITSGATNIDLGGLSVVVKNYTSISITSTGSLTFSNPHANGTIIILKSQGNVTITSSTVPAINASGMGASSASNGNTTVFVRTKTGVAGVTTGTRSVGGVALGGNVLLTKTLPLACGAGGVNGVTGDGGSNGEGGGGGASVESAGTNGAISSTGASNASGAGGAGGGALLIECAGAYNVSSTITVAGLVGGADAGGASAGGGGGAGGTITILYNTLTSNTGTYIVSAGAGGSRGGGAGGAGYSLVTLNTEFT